MDTWYKSWMDIRVVYATAKKRQLRLCLTTTPNSKQQEREMKNETADRGGSTILVYLRASTIHDPQKTGVPCSSVRVPVHIPGGCLTFSTVRYLVVVSLRTYGCEARSLVFVGDHRTYSILIPVGDAFFQR